MNTVRTNQVWDYFLLFTKLEYEDIDINVKKSQNKQYTYTITLKEEKIKTNKM